MMQCQHTDPEKIWYTLTQVYTSESSSRCDECVELYGDTTGKSDEKLKNRCAKKSPVVVLTYFPLAIV